MGAQTAGHKPRGRKQNSLIYDAFHHVLLDIWIKLVTSFWRRNSAAMVPQSAPPGLHPLVRARMKLSARRTDGVVRTLDSLV